MSVTYQNILDQYDDITREASESRYYLSDAQVDRFANRALSEISERARYFDYPVVMNGVADQHEYTLADSVIALDVYDVWRVEYDDEVLWPITKDQLRKSDRSWATRSGRPRFYYLDEHYTTDDDLTVGIWEAPSANLTNGLRIWTHLASVSMDYSSAPILAAEVPIPEWAAGAMLFYMLHLTYLADTQLQNFDTAYVYKMMYEDLLDRLVARSRDRIPKRWISGAPSSPSLNVLNRLPQRITP